MNATHNEKNIATFQGNPLLLRRRLTDRIGTLLETSNLHVMGPAGCGKTALIQSFLQTCPSPTLHVPIKSSSFDDTALADILAEQFSTICNTSISSLPQKNTAYIKNFFNTLFSYNEPGIIIWIDNYERIKKNSNIHQIIQLGIEKKHKNHKFIITSRSKLPDTFIRNISHSEIKTIYPSDIKFTKKEIESIFPELFTSKITFQDLDTVLDGWITGYTIFANTIFNYNSDLRDIDLLRVKEIHSYFEQEVFSHIPKEIQLFLKKICIPKSIDLPFAESLSGDSNALSHLSYITDNNIFTSEKHTHKHPYTIHPYFKAFLFNKIKNELTKQELTKNIRNTCALLQYSGTKEEAYDILINNKDWEGAAQLIEVNAEKTIHDRGGEYFKKQLKRIPGKNLDNKIWLRYWEAVSIQKSDPHKSINLQKKILPIFESHNDYSGMYLSWSRIVEILITTGQETEKLNKILKVYEHISKLSPEYPTQEVQKTCISALMSIYCLLIPESEEIDKNPPDNFIPCTSDISLLYSFLYGVRLILMGDFEHASLYISRISKIIHPESKIPACLATYLGMYKSEYDTIIKNDTFSATEAETLYGIWGTIVKINSMISADNIDAASSEIEILSKKIETYPLLKCLLYITKTKLALSLQNIDQADLFLEIAEEQTKNVRLPFIHARIKLLESYIAHLQDNHEKSTRALLDAEKITHKLKSSLLAYQTDMLRYYVSKEDKKLTKALGLGSKFNYTDNILGDKNFIFNICSTSLQSDKAHPHIHNLITKHQILPQGPALHLEKWPWPLKIYTLGRFSVVINGKTIKFSRRAQQKPLSMLKVIISLGGRKIREDLISDALWPDADGDIAHQSFATTLHRLRKLIGHHETIEVQNKLVSLNSRMCWVDSWVFERICGEADEAWSRSKKYHFEASEITKKAIAMYHGTFLGSEAWRPWILPLQEKLQSKFIRCVKNMARFHENREDWSAAITCYAMGLEVDNLSEELYCGLIGCYQKVNLFSDAILTYNRCKKTLNCELEIDPSPKTTALWKNIQRQSRSTAH